jgi:hypothetical protein
MSIVPTGKRYFTGGTLDCFRRKWAAGTTEWHRALQWRIFRNIACDRSLVNRSAVLEGLASEFLKEMDSSKS